jgi:alcohol dehydrogenase
MLSVPPDLTAYQGFDAFCHSAEGYIAKNANIISDLYALKSVELVAHYLPRAVKDGHDLEARTMVALANTLAGMVESTSSCTCEHSMEHAMSAYHSKLPHGAGLIMLLDAYFGFYADKIPGRLGEMARVMDVNVDGIPEKEHGRAFLQALRDLEAACGVAQLKMSDYGITRAEIPQLAKNARATMGGLYRADPIPLSDEDVIKIYEAAYR